MKQKKTNIFNLIYQLFINWAETKILETFKIVLVVIVQKKTKATPIFDPKPIDLWFVNLWNSKTRTPLNQKNNFHESLEQHFLERILFGKQRIRFTSAKLIVRKMKMLLKRFAV